MCARAHLLKAEHSGKLRVGHTKQLRRHRVQHEDAGGGQQAADAAVDKILEAEGREAGLLVARDPFEHIVVASGVERLGVRLERIGWRWWRGGGCCWRTLGGGRRLGWDLKLRTVGGGRHAHCKTRRDWRESR